MLENYRLTLVRPACDPNSVTLGAVVEFDEDVSEVLPYLNATLKGCRYYPDGPFLRFVYEGRAVTLHARHFTVGRLADEAEARQVVEGVARLVNETWARRDRIEPSFKRGTEVTALQVFRCLPRTNCRRCGEPTCLSFAARVASGLAGPEDCPPLAEPERQQAAAELRRLLGLT